MWEVTFGISFTVSNLNYQKTSQWKKMWHGFRQEWFVLNFFFSFPFHEVMKEGFFKTSKKVLISVCSFHFFSLFFWKAKRTFNIVFVGISQICTLPVDARNNKNSVFSVCWVNKQTKKQIVKKKRSTKRKKRADREGNQLATRAYQQPPQSFSCSCSTKDVNPV